MSAQHWVPAATLNDICPRLLTVVEDMLQHYPPNHVVGCYWFTLGFLLAQLGSVPPAGLELMDVEAFKAGYDHGLECPELN